jgi:hypothetical protein
MFIENVNKAPVLTTQERNRIPRTKNILKGIPINNYVNF